jgi:hypothetical protein
LISDDWLINFVYFIELKLYEFKEVVLWELAVEFVFVFRFWFGSEILVLKSNNLLSCDGDKSAFDPDFNLLDNILAFLIPDGWVF